LTTINNNNKSNNNNNNNNINFNNKYNMTTNYTNNKKKTTKNKKKDCNGSIQFPWQTGVYHCFLLDIKACTCQLMQTGELFTMQTKQHQPPMSVKEVHEYFKKVEPLVKISQTGHPPIKQDKIHFGVVSRADYLYLIVCRLDHIEMGLLRSPAGKEYFKPMVDHDWFHMLMVT
jgi:hypothetical protein